MNFYRKIIQTSLFKITSLNSFSVVLKIGIGLITSKILAVFVGPSGMALVGNLRNFLTSLENISTLGFQNGIVKYAAENEKNKNELQKIVSTVLISLIFLALLLSGVLFFTASFWNEKIFGNNSEYLIVFKVLALVLPTYGLSIFLIAVINGLGKFQKVIWINIFGNIIGLLTSIVLILQFKTTGALLAIVIAPALLFVITLYLVQKEIQFLQFIKVSLFDFKVVKNLSSYSLMALVSSVFGPFVFLAIRNHIIQNLGVEQAGYWETITRISSYYLLFVSTILSVYFLPRLSKAQDDLEAKSVVWQFYKFILPIFILGLTILYFGRFFVVKLLFTQEFLPVTDLFFWQLLGDVFKVCSLILGLQFFAKKRTAAFIITELFSFSVLYFASLYITKIFQIEGIVIAYAFQNFIYLLVLSIYFRKSLF
ncbi:PST family polysaccharide transporter [Flavobacterium nitrogenifigens]|uniref:PST family polysaccharide transporter n=2 Tax=Flavobacterium TaxID=237 RepID=A0A7W7N920_9FLAO|nr:O-antigen translocase [Flavobacterium notoginsengisoli]MBB4803014.1 PST family polysaccharide transporter [Flavobacterium nitrogenifigens]MBB6387972.1 PST family polysaccharide transporter [Flavobacterium notoginsengisoli]